MFIIIIIIIIIIITIIIIIIIINDNYMKITNNKCKASKYTEYGTKENNNYNTYAISYRKIPKISPSKYKPPKLVTRKTLR